MFLLPRTVPGQFICVELIQGVLELVILLCQASSCRPASALFHNSYQWLSQSCSESLLGLLAKVRCSISEQQWFSTLPSFLYEKDTNECFFMRRKVASVAGVGGAASLHPIILVPVEGGCPSHCVGGIRGYRHDHSLRKEMKESGWCGVPAL